MGEPGTLPGDIACGEVGPESSKLPLVLSIL